MELQLGTGKVMDSIHEMWKMGLLGGKETLETNRGTQSRVEKQTAGFDWNNSI